MKPLIPAHLVAVAVILVPILEFGSHFLPFPIGALLGILAYVAAALAGLGSSVPTWLPTKALVPITLVPTLASIAAVLAGMAETTPGVLGLVYRVASLVLTLLAGKVIPEPLAVDPLKAAEATANRVSALAGE